MTTGIVELSEKVLKIVFIVHAPSVLLSPHIRLYGLPKEQLAGHMCSWLAPTENAFDQWMLSSPSARDNLRVFLQNTHIRLSNSSKQNNMS